MTEHFITIPCKPDKPDRISPILIYVGKDAKGADRCEYKCPYCGQAGPRRKPIAMHMGLFADKPTGCKVLLAQDASRRQSQEELFL